MSEDTLFWLIVGTAVCASLLAALLAPGRHLLLSLALLSLAGLATVVFFMDVTIFRCGGEICLTGLIVAIFTGAAAVLGDLILLGRWLWRRFHTATDSSPT